MVRAGSEPARTANQPKGMQALNRRILRENSRPGFFCGAWRTNLKTLGLVPIQDCIVGLILC